MKRLPKLIAAGDFDALARMKFTADEVESLMITAENEIEADEELVEGITKINAALKMKLENAQKRIEVNKNIISNGEKLLEMIEKGEILDDYEE